MNTVQMPPPRRFLVSDDESGIPYLEEVTGTEDIVYIVGMESPWLGISLDELEKYMKEGAYGLLTWRLEDQIKRARAGETFFDTGEDNDET